MNAFYNPHQRCAIFLRTRPMSNGTYRHAYEENALKEFFNLVFYKQF